MLACDPRVSAQHFRPLPVPLLPLFTPLLPSGQDSRSFSAKSGLPARKKGGGEGPRGVLPQACLTVSGPSLRKDQLSCSEPFL